MTPSTLKIFYEPKDRLRLTVGDECSYPTVKPAWAAPLSRPNTYLALLDGKGDEIVTVADPAELPKASREAVEEELRRRYLTATVLTVQNAKLHSTLPKRTGRVPSPNTDRSGGTSVAPTRRPRVHT